jgi:NAD(P)-dependent dehydrogenase (short-subunit alcohol dehydrogenase family)
VSRLLLDVTDENSIERARVTVAEATGGRRGALVNNAGIAVGGALETVPPHPDARLGSGQILRSAPAPGSRLSFDVVLLVSTPKSRGMHQPFI